MNDDNEKPPQNVGELYRKHKPVWDALVLLLVAAVFVIYFAYVAFTTPEKINTNGVIAKAIGGAVFALAYLTLTNRKRAQQIVGRERRERVSQLAWCGEGALIRAAASTQPFGVMSGAGQSR